MLRHDIENGYITYKVGCESFAGVPFPFVAITGAVADKELVIPEFIDDKPVRKIAKDAFRESALEKICLPDSLTTIEDDAFEGSKIKNITFGKGLVNINTHAFFDCTKLEEVEFNDGLMYIGPRAFYGCMALNSFILPDSVRYVGKDVIDYCPAIKKIHLGKYADLDVDIRGDFAFNADSLEEITVHPDNKNHVIIDGVLYGTKDNILIKGCPESPITSIKVPEWVDKCAYFALTRMHSLKLINFKTAFINNIHVSGLADLGNIVTYCLPNSRLKNWCISSGFTVKERSKLYSFLEEVDNDKSRDGDDI